MPDRLASQGACGGAPAPSAHNSALKASLGMLQPTAEPDAELAGKLQGGECEVGDSGGGAAEVLRGTQAGARRRGSKLKARGGSERQGSGHLHFLRLTMPGCQPHNSNIRTSAEQQQQHAAAAALLLPRPSFYSTL